jgi:hypothetical protein
VSRWDSGTNETAAAQRHVVLVMFCQLDLPSGTLYLHDSAGSFTWGYHTWSGVGSFGGVERVSEALDTVAVPVDLTLSGVDPSLVSDAMTTQYHGEAATLYVGLVNPDTGALVADPQEVWGGYMDVMTIEIDQGSATISLRCESRLRRKPAVARYTDEDLQLRYSGDNFFAHLHTVGQQRRWGGSTVAAGGGAGQSSGTLIRQQR